MFRQLIDQKAIRAQENWMHDNPADAIHETAQEYLRILWLQTIPWQNFQIYFDYCELFRPFIFNPNSKKSLFEQLTLNYFSNGFFSIRCDFFLQNSRTGLKTLHVPH